MSILTVTEFRGHIPGTSLTDAVLQRYLDAAEADIVERVGASGDVTEYVYGGMPRLIVSRPISAVTSITEDTDSTALVLASDDYRFIPAGFVIERLNLGTNPAYAWLGRVGVVYTPVEDEATRQRVQIALVKLDLAYSGFQSESEPQFSRVPNDYVDEREELLDSLSPRMLMTVLG